MHIQTHYNPDEHCTVKDYFSNSERTLAYQTIARLGIEPCGRYRAPNKKGKSSALYWRRDLQKVADQLKQREQSLVTELPAGTLDLAAIEQIYNLPRAIVGKLFSYVGMESVGVYNRNGSRRTSKLFATHDVDVVFRALKRCKDSLAERDIDTEQFSMPCNSDEAGTERSHK